MDDHFVANLPVFDFFANGPHNAGSVRTGYVKFGAVNIKRADWYAQSSPDSIVVHARGHHQYQHFVAVGFRHVNYLKPHGLVRFTMTFPANCPGVHFLRHETQRRQLAHVVKLFFRRLIGRDTHIRVKCQFDLHIAVLLHCSIHVLGNAIPIRQILCNASAGFPAKTARAVAKITVRHNLNTEQTVGTTLFDDGQCHVMDYGKAGRCYFRTSISNLDSTSRHCETVRMHSQFARHGNCLGISLS